MSSESQNLIVEVQPLELFPSRDEEWKLLGEPGTNDTTPRIDLASLQLADTAENLKLLVTPPLRRTLSIVPSTPQEWADNIHLDLKHISNADLAGGKRKRNSSV